MDLAYLTRPLDAAPSAWQPLLHYVRDLRRRALRPPAPPLTAPWEEIGPGYCYGPAFGHWDIVHQAIDALGDDPVHAARQVANNLGLQQPDGLLPGSLWLSREGRLTFSAVTGHPPVWPVAVSACQLARPDPAALAVALATAERQLAWFARERAVPGGGFFYTDLTARSWESGVDEGVRFDSAPQVPATCLDATCHVAFLAKEAAGWARTLGRDHQALDAQAETLESFIRERLWCPETGFFHDAWAITDPRERRLLHEGFWPLALGIATAEQARSLIDRYLLDPRHFLTTHPIPSVALSEPAFSLRMWRGPTWNSITWWVAQGCVAYGRADAARMLLSRALDAAAEVFARSKAIWEFYHPQGGDPLLCARKPHTPYNTPCRDYLGHNPLRAMARLHASLPAVR